MNEEAAQALSLQALAFLAADELRLGALLEQAGWSLEDLRAQANNPVVLAGVMDFLLSDERLVVAFCEMAGCPMEQPMRARAHLPGGRFE